MLKRICSTDKKFLNFAEKLQPMDIIVILIKGSIDQRRIRIYSYVISKIKSSKYKYILLEYINMKYLQV